MVHYLTFPILLYFQSNRSQWQMVFAIAAAIFFFGNLIYIIWGTAVSQPWDAEDYLVPKDTESSVKENSSDVKAIEAEKKDTENESS